MRKISFLLFFLLLMGGCGVAPLSLTENLSEKNLTGGLRSDMRIEKLVLLDQRQIEEDVPHELHPLRYTWTFYRVDLTGTRIAEMVSPLVINDPTWKIELLPVKFVDKEFDTFKCHYYLCDEQSDRTYLPGQDAKNIYPGQEYSWAVAYEDLSWYVPLQLFWIQDIVGAIGYSSGYLIVYPYKLPVDAQSIQYISKVLWPQMMSYSDGMKFDGYDWKQVRALNGGEQYANIIGSDKDRVYFRSLAPGIHYAFNRVPKKSDFRILPPQEYWYFISRDPDFQLERYRGNVSNFKRLEEGIVGPDLLYHQDFVYLSGENDIWRFRVDWASLRYLQKEPTKEGEIWYALLSDKNRYYHIVYDVNGDYHELQRTRK